MPSLSKTVFANGWMTISSWIVYLGFNLIAISTPTAAQAGPESVAPSPDSALQSPTSNLTTEPDLVSARRTFISKSVVETESGIEAEPPSETAVAAEVSPSGPARSPSDPLPDLLPDQGSRPLIVAAEPTVTTGSTPASAPVTVTVSAEQCLADCNPGERFNFDAPTDIAIPPRSAYPRPVYAENPVLPVPGYPSVAGQGSANRNSANPDAVPPPPAVATSPSRPLAGADSVAPTAQTPQSRDSEVLSADTASRRALTPPSLQLQGVYIYQGSEGSARARVTGVYPILPELQVGGSIDFTDGDVFSESGDDGLEVNELYVAASIPDYPNLRLVVGQIDLTSYFDRNSFAKDSAQQFFNPVFATNPALSAAALGSRQGALVNWTITDEIEAKAAVFSSDRSISDFELNAFAGEIGARLGNLIIRGTYVTAEDAGANTSFEESFQIQRSNGEFGPRDGDREDAYGINAEYFIPEINLGLFARYGWYENRDLDRGGSTYSVGVNLLDLFMEDDRLGIAYGRTLSNDDLRDGENPDVFEAFYDFRVLPGLRLGLTFQGLDEFSETIAGFRIRTDFDLVPRRTP